jgi:MFS superfamily sulfate permease-like transporter
MMYDVCFVFFTGVCVSLISDPVTTGFTAGAALTIAMSQLKSLLGFATATGGNLIGYWTDLFHNLYSGTYSVPDTMLGLSCVFLLTLLQVLVMKVRRYVKNNL